VDEAISRFKLGERFGTGVLGVKLLPRFEAALCFGRLFG
jgi:hypothetical protein